MSCLNIGYASLVKNLLKFEHVKAYFSSFRVFWAYLDLFIWAHLGPFRARIGSFCMYV